MSLKLLTLSRSSIATLTIQSGAAGFTIRYGPYGYDSLPVAKQELRRFGMLIKQSSYIRGKASYALVDTGTFSRFGSKSTFLRS